MVDHVEARHEEVGETGPLYRHVFGKSSPSLSTHNRNTYMYNLTGHGHRHQHSHPNPLEIPRQRQRRTVLLAPRHVGHLVLFRGRRHHHRAMRSRAAGAGQRCSLDVPFDIAFDAAVVEAAGVHG
jgi:hypothetical protein